MIIRMRKPKNAKSVSRMVKAMKSLQAQGFDIQVEDSGPYFFVAVLGCWSEQADMKGIHGSKMAGGNSLFLSQYARFEELHVWLKGRVCNSPNKRGSAVVFMDKKAASQAAQSVANALLMQGVANVKVKPQNGDGFALVALGDVTSKVDADALRELAGVRHCANEINSARFYGKHLSCFEGVGSFFRWGF